MEYPAVNPKAPSDAPGFSLARGADFVREKSAGASGVGAQGAIRDAAVEVQLCQVLES